MKILVVDNGSQYAHRIYRTLQDLKAETKLVPNTTPVSELNCDGIVLSGSGVLLSAGAPMGNCKDYLDNFKGPILGICAGHQLIGGHFGGKISPASGNEGSTPEFGLTEITIDKENDLFKGIPAKISAWESHNDEISELPKDLESLAHSESCAVEALKHRKKPIYGIQFHPEVQHTQHGKDIYKNFIGIVKR